KTQRSSSTSRRGRALAGDLRTGCSFLDMCNLPVGADGGRPRAGTPGPGARNRPPCLARAGQRTATHPVPAGTPPLGGGGGLVPGRYGLVGLGEVGLMDGMVKMVSRCHRLSTEKTARSAN